MVSKEVIDGTGKLLTKSLSLSPFMFDRVQIRGIRRKKEKNMSSVKKEKANIRAFMESSIVDDNDTVRR